MHDKKEVTSTEGIAGLPSTFVADDRREPDRRDEIIRLLDEAWLRALAEFEALDRAA